MEKPFIFCDDGWLLNVAKCNYIRPRNKENDKKKTVPQIVFNYGQNNEVSSSFATQKERDKTLEYIREHLSFMYMDESK